MPVQTDQNDFAQLYNVQNQDQFSKLAVYFALNQVERIPQLEVYSKLFGDIPWQPNMGTTLQGVRIEPTPKTRGVFRPAAITGRANKDIFDQREYREQAVLYWHKFESPLIYFLRNFQDFIRDQIKPAMEDVNEQVVFANDVFIRTYMWDRAPYVYIAGKANPYTSAPSVSVHNPGNTDPKNAAYVESEVVPQVASALTLPTVNHALVTLINDAGAVPLNGGASALPKENDLLAGKYCLITSHEAASQWIFDEGFDKWRSNDEDYIRNRFLSGPLFGQVVVKGEQHPQRFKNDGTVVAPEIMEDETGETFPNPDYANPDIATIEKAWIVGKDAYRSVKIGPPPKEFAGGSASAKQVNGMNWNGKVRLTDRVLLRATVNDETVYEANAYGEYLKLICSLTMGCLPGRPRSAFPILFRRRRMAEVGNS